MIEGLDYLTNKLAPILRHHGVSRAAIFGSFARGEATEGSDIDILVELNEEKSLLDLVALKLDLEDAAGRSVDLVEYSSIHPGLRDRILREQVSVI
ncbi:MAG: nucleotidyltransferase family protein [Methanothrix sp.]|nr:nucleotidyltransferase family protein [Methanothrix sp.]